MITSKAVTAVRKAMREDRAEDLVKALDMLKSSYALEAVLLELTKTGNQHTLQSTLRLIRKGREK